MVIEGHKGKNILEFRQEAKKVWTKSWCWNGEEGTGGSKRQREGEGSWIYKLWVVREEERSRLPRVWAPCVLWGKDKMYVVWKWGALFQLTESEVLWTQGSPPRTETTDAANAGLRRCLDYEVEEYIQAKKWAEVHNQDTKTLLEFCDMRPWEHRRSRRMHRCSITNHCKVCKGVWVEFQQYSMGLSSRSEAIIWAERGQGTQKRLWKT